MVNWDPKALTALSDEEVIYKEEHGKLYYLSYKIEGENGYAVVATTRPETIMGDTAMCINPKDPKNRHLKGKKVIVPLVNRVIPVIEDEYVDIEFGTGCLKVTPAHDVNDYMLGENTISRLSTSSMITVQSVKPPDYTSAWTVSMSGNKSKRICKPPDYLKKRKPIPIR